MEKLKAILEGLIFASEEPLSLASLTAMTEELGVERAQVRTTLEELTKEYNENEAKGFMLREIDGGYQFITKPSVAEWVQKLHAVKPRSLSQAALETLAIIAYRQPLIRPEVEAIRGVDCGGVLKTLLERGLIKIVGRRDEVGQPLIYGTTPAFLELFHLSTLEELPSMRDIEAMVAAGQNITIEGSDSIVGEVEFEEDDPAIPVIVSEEVLMEDQSALEELDSSLKSLRTLETEMFPKEEKTTTEEPVAETKDQPETPPTETH